MNSDIQRIPLNTYLSSRVKKRDPSDDEKTAVKKAFYLSDEGHKGYLTPEDMKVANLILFGYKPSKRFPLRAPELQIVGGPKSLATVFSIEVRKMWPISMESSCEGLTLSQFEEIMYKKSSVRDEDDKIRQTFLTFDTNCITLPNPEHKIIYTYHHSGSRQKAIYADMNGRGFLTKEDVRKAFSTVAHLPSQTIDSAFHELDRDGDGRISYRDFEFMMKYRIEAE